MNTAAQTAADHGQSPAQETNKNSQSQGGLITGAAVIDGEIQVNHFDPNKLDLEDLLYPIG